MTIKKCKIDCIRKSSNNLSEDDLFRIIEISKNIRLLWGDKYAEFKYAKDPEDKSFPMKGFYPHTGSNDILGEVVKIKLYTSPEFLNLYTSSDFLVALDVDTSNVGACNELFSSSNVTWYTDYSQLVTYLENSKYLRTKQTENWLSVDGRKFKLNKKFVECVPQLETYSQTYYEVDSLGTSLFSELTKFMEILYEYVQKPLK